MERVRDIDSRDGFSEMVRPHLASMEGLAAALAGRDDAADVVQEALARAWRKRDVYDPLRGTPRTWLLAITADQARRSKRRRLASRTIGMIGVVGESAGSPDVYEDVDLRRAVSALPPRQRQAIACFYYADLSIEETAAVMRCALGTVKSNLADARRRLATKLGDSE